MSTPPNKLVVFGAGGHSRVVADLAICAGFEVLGFVDESMPLGQLILGRAVLGKASWLKGRGQELVVALGIGDNRTRAASFQACQDAGVACPPLIHPRASVSASATIGEGTVVMAGAVVNAEAALGRGVIVNSGAVVEHECPVGDFAHLSPNATLGGRARLEAYVHLGLCACVLPGCVVGEGTVVGAGAVVHRSLPAGVTAVGVPAKVLRPR